MKYYRLYIILAVVLLSVFVSCNETKDGELIPPVSVEEMGLTLLELQYAEQKSIGNFPDSISSVNKKMDRNFDTLAFYYQEVLERNHTDFESFKEHLNWYKSNAQFLDQALNYAKEVLESHMIEKDEEGEEHHIAPKAIEIMDEGVDSLPGGLQRLKFLKEEDLLDDIKEGNTKNE